MSPSPLVVCCSALFAIGAGDCGALVLARPDGSEVVTGRRAVVVRDGVAALDFSGVVRLDGQFGDRATGILLRDGRHVLTAAHCAWRYRGRSGLEWNTATIFSEGATLEVKWEAVVVHPEYRPELGVLGGHDVAVIRLDREVPVEFAARYEVGVVWSGPGVAFVKAGFGNGGNGRLGSCDSDGKLRMGWNRADLRVEGEVRDRLAAVFCVARTDARSLMVYDLDDGTGARDAAGALARSAGVGLVSPGCGAAEALAAAGDSGGPSFVYDGTRGSWVVAAVSAGTYRPAQDSDGVLNSSFGELGVDVWADTICDWLEEAIEKERPPAVATPRGMEAQRSRSTTKNNNNP